MAGDTILYDPLAVGLQLASLLEQRGIPCAIGGALAYGLWGVPRFTKDLDINVFAAGERLRTVFAVLRELGCTVDEAVAMEEAVPAGVCPEGSLGVTQRGKPQALESEDNKSDDICSGGTRGRRGEPRGLHRHSLRRVHASPLRSLST